MKRRGRTLISAVLAMLMAFSAAPAFAAADDSAAAGQNTEIAMKAASAPVPADRAAEAVNKFADAMTKFATDTSEMSGLMPFLTRFGGLTSAASGVVGILQLSGIIQDPTKQMLGEILATVRDIQTQLTEMDAKLDGIQKDLVNVQVSIEEKDRNNKAASMLKNWDDFNKDYCEPLDKYIEQYKRKVDDGIEAWWKKGPQTGVSVVYTLTANEKGEKVRELTYVNTPYYADLKAVPAVAANGEAVEKDLSFGVPKACIPDTKSISFDIKKYRTDFIGKMKASFITAANGKKLIAEPAFYTAWNKLSAAQKDEAAAAYAQDILNTWIYHISCDVMTANNEWVGDVLVDYREYCDHVLQQDSGINAMLNAMYLTHGFEGEIKDDISKFCSAMVAKTGLYGQFALSCAGQDRKQDLEGMQELQKLFTDTVIDLSGREEKALTGHDNYCYITSTLVEYAWLDADATMTVKTESVGSGYAFREFSSTDWSLTVPNLLNNVYSQVLYHQYQTQNQGKSSFSSYLKAYGAFPWDDWDGDIMTTYHGGQDFAFSEGIRMKASSFFSGESYFSSGQYYNIDVGTGSKVEQQYYHVHDKLMVDTFNMGTGELKVNQMAGARAFYGENHGNWITDEAWSFATDEVSVGNKQSKSGDTTTHSITDRIHIVALRLKPVLNLNGEGDEPFFAFGGPTITPGISDVMGPIVEDRTTPLTGVKLKKDKNRLKNDRYTYTGKAIRPKVTVKAGGKTVPSSGYKVTYMDNRDLGCAVISVEGKGKYSGKVVKLFRIIPKGTAIKKIKKKGRSVTLKWKKQKAKMSGARIGGYQIRYSTSPKMTKAVKVTVKGWGKTARKIKGLKKNRKYYFQIRTYSAGKGHKIYSKWSGRKAVK